MIKIVIVGGGAGGLELATSLGHSLGKKRKAEITLVDQSLTHIWKPLLHEVAVGTLNNFSDEINFISHAYQHYFNFQLGELYKINRMNKTISILYPFPEASVESMTLSYDILILAIGSSANNFNTPGADQHCLYLDNLAQAKHIHQLLLHKIFEQRYTSESPPFNVAIVGGGATGVELAAELHSAFVQMSKMGLVVDAQQRHIRVTVIESFNRLLPTLPERISQITLNQLTQQGVVVLTNKRVIEISEQGLTNSDGTFIAANIIIWAAGIKGQPRVSDFSDFELNQRQQIVVKPTLQTTVDDRIFAFGDCAACPMPDGQGLVPARAQAAHQQAALLQKSIPRYLKQQPLSHYRYRDRGSLISLSRHRTVGQVMGKMHKNLLIEGWVARFFYLMLYKMHQAKLFGWYRVVVMTFASLITRRLRSRLKLH